MQTETFFPEVFSDSMLADVYTCELKWFRQNCQKYNSFKTNPDLRAGIAFAKACEITRKAFFFEGFSMLESIEKGQVHIEEAEDTGHEVKTNILISKRFKRYFETFPLEGDFRPVKLANGEYAVEHKFEFEMPILHPETNKPLVFKCILDSIVEKVYAGNRVQTIIQDEKTTEKLSRLPYTISSEYPNGIVDIEKETNNYRLSSQLLAYCFAAKVAGIKVNKAHIMRVPLSKNYEPAIRLEIDINDFMINNWYDSIISKISDLAGKYIAWKKYNEAIPQTFFKPSYKNDCVSYGRLCEFYRGCTSEDGEEILSKMFDQKVYDRKNRIMVDLQEYKKNLKLS